jgi:type II secretory pathway component PulM
MNDIMAIVSDFLAGLQPRERLVLKIGALVLAGVLIVLMLLPKWTVFVQVKEQRDGLKADMSWLQEKQELVVELANNCPKLRQKNDNFKTDLSQLVRRNQLEVLSAKEKGNLISLTVTGTKSNKFVGLIHHIACRGYMLREVALTTADDDLSKTTATFEVERVN